MKELTTKATDWRTHQKDKVLVIFQNDGGKDTNSKITKRGTDMGKCTVKGDKISHTEGDNYSLKLPKVLYR